MKDKTSSCLLHQDTDAGGIDWGDSDAAPVQIEIVDAGTDCEIIVVLFKFLIMISEKHAQLKTFRVYGSGPEGVARGEDALSLLENSQSRSQFIDELMEVKTAPIYGPMTEIINWINISMSCPVIINRFINKMKINKQIKKVIV